MADAELQSEEDLVASKTLSKVDVLKVGHHGSKDSSSAAFLQIVKPTFSIISVGAKKSYNHPTPETLDNLKAINTNVYRTDQKGSIVVTSNGLKITSIKTKKK